MTSLSPSYFLALFFLKKFSLARFLSVFFFLVLVVILWWMSGVVMVGALAGG